MKTVKIYLRSVEIDGTKHLAMFDSNRNGAIDNLTTEVPGGADVIWQLDCCSGISRITKIYPVSDETVLFKTPPSKQLLCRGFKHHIPEKFEGTEKYCIEFIPCDSSEPVIIDPYLRVPPPPRK